jgi:arginase
MRIQVMGLPLGLGAGCPGAARGPRAIRRAGLGRALARLGHEVLDAGDVELPPAGTAGPTRGMRHLPEVASACARLADAVCAALRAGWLPLVLGGDHSLTIGLLAGRRRAGRAGGVIWLDAHGDFNTPETSPSGNIHGMALAAAAGRGARELVGLGGGPSVTEQAAALVGVRALDPGERAALAGSAVSVFPMADLARRGSAAVLRAAVAVASADGRNPFHVSLDLDVLDPACAPGVGTPVPGGLSVPEARDAMAALRASGLVDSVDAVECNPLLDPGERTAALAVALLAALLGG